MMLRIARTVAVLAMAFAMVGLGIAPGQAEDGVIEINQAKINASGFPIFSITAPGSYKLTSNITVSTLVTEAISIGASQVTLDLNGFTISGSGVGNSDIFAQAGTSQFVVRNGTIVGNSNDACLGLGNADTSSIDHVSLSACGVGITMGANSRVTNSTLNLPSGSTTGIDCKSGCLVENTTINAPNGQFLLFFHDPTSLYGENVINAGSGGIGVVTGGTSLGNNVCTSSGSTTKC